MLEKLKLLTDLFPMWGAEWNVSSKELTTFRIGGPVLCLIHPSGMGDFVAALQTFGHHQIPYRVIGGGSNILQSDSGFMGVWIATDRLTRIDIHGSRVIAEAGVTVTQLITKGLESGLGGYENLMGIPGTVGGGLYMNAGAYGTQIGDLVASVLVWRIRDGAILQLERECLQLGYRNSVFQSKEYIILSCELQLTPGRRDIIESRANRVKEERMEKQPVEYPSAGSTFKRPQGFYAAKLIKEAGFVGLRVGDAMVSQKHSGFVVNLGNATSEDVKTLISLIKDGVKHKFGVELTMEVELWE